MQLLLKDNLPFIVVTIAYSGQTVEALMEFWGWIH
jgi:hypothetical protein